VLLSTAVIHKAVERHRALDKGLGFPYGIYPVSALFRVGNMGLPTERSNMPLAIAACQKTMARERVHVQAVIVCK